MSFDFTKTNFQRDDIKNEMDRVEEEVKNNFGILITLKNLQKIQTQRRY